MDLELRPVSTTYGVAIKCVPSLDQLVELHDALNRLARDYRWMFCAGGEITFTLSVELDTDERHEEIRQAIRSILAVPA